MSTDVDVTLGGQIRRRREELDLTQAEVGFLAGVHRATIRMVETDRSSEVKTLSNVLRVLGCAAAISYAKPDLETKEGTIRPLLSVSTTRAVTSALLTLEREVDTNSGEAVVGVANMHTAYSELMDSIAASKTASADEIRRGVKRVDLPASFEEFRAFLPLTRQQRVALDRELHRIFGVRYPYRNTQATSYGGGTSRAYATKIAANDAAHQVDGTTEVDVVPSIEPAQGEAHFRMGIGLGATTELRPITGEGHAVEANDRMASSGTVGPPRPEIRAILASGLPESVQGDLIEFAIAWRHRYEMQLTDEVMRMIGDLQSQLAREKSDGDDDG